jgi:MFS superfamily sulfate permease-like transporter
MVEHKINYYLQHWKTDALAGIVVFLVALPLCLGIALASGAPPFAGVIAGAIGGIVVSLASGSQLSVSGPANGVTIVAAAAIANFGYRGLLLSVVIAGAIQIALGFMRAGAISAYFPSSVIRGMLAAIGMMLMMKQLPHALGYDKPAEDDLSFLEESGQAEVSVIEEAFNSVSPGAILLSVTCLAILFLWDTRWIKSNRFLSPIPAPLFVVAFGGFFHIFTSKLSSYFSIQPGHLVNLPAFESFEHLRSEIVFPDFSMITNPHIFMTAFTLALIASLESLLSLEAADKLDPLRRVAPTDKELKAQGLGNFLSGLLGGIPLSAVIVRTSVNINAGGRTKLASFIHGVCIVISVMFFVEYLNLIPLSCLAAILIYTGFKLTKPAIFSELYEQGLDQFVPFIITILAMLTLDSLRGVAIGLAVGLIFVLKNNYHQAFSLTVQGDYCLLKLKKDVSFLHKAPLRNLLDKIPENSMLFIDGTQASFIDRDIMETINDFVKAGTDRNIKVELKNVGHRRSYEERGSLPIGGSVRNNNQANV